jgi:acyl-CoA thioesterase FadM
MTRITLEECPYYEFSHSLTIRFTDVNLAAHLATDALVGLLQEARAQALRKMGFSSLNLGEEKIGLVIADLVVNFRQEGAAFDTLQIESHFGDIGKRSMRLYHRITRESELLALAETGLVCFDYAARQPTPIPEQFISALKDQQGAMEKAK